MHAAAKLGLLKTLNCELCTVIPESKCGVLGN